MSLDVLNHRVMELERLVKEHDRGSATRYKELEMRIRVLEIAHARLVAYAAGGAFVGGVIFQVVQLLFR